MCLVLGNGFVEPAEKLRSGDTLFAALPTGYQLAIEDSIQDLMEREVWRLVRFPKAVGTDPQQQFADALKVLASSAFNTQQAGTAS